MPLTSQIDDYLLSLKAVRPKLMWRDILTLFSTKWPDKTWKVAPLQMRWTRLNDRQRQAQEPSSLSVPQIPSLFTTNPTNMGSQTTLPPMHDLRFNSLSRTYNEYVPLELNTFAKCKEYGAGSLLGMGVTQSNGSRLLERSLPLKAYCTWM